MDTPFIPMEEVRRHMDATYPPSVWIVINGSVYDVTSFLEEHPGGEQVLLKYAGREATQAFEDVGHSKNAREQMKQFKLGNVEPKELLEEISKTQKKDVKHSDLGHSGPEQKNLRVTSQKKKVVKNYDLGNLCPEQKNVKVTYQNTIESNIPKLSKLHSVDTVKKTANKQLAGKCSQNPEPEKRAVKCPMGCSDTPEPETRPPTCCAAACDFTPKEVKRTPLNCPMGCPDAPGDPFISEEVLTLGLLALVAGLIIGFVIKRIYSAE